MPYVVTQSCCADASCVLSCPVNAIHPTPDEPEFATAEMLWVDPVTCVDCGACATACPVDAIRPHTALGPADLPFVELNAAYYDTHPHADRPALALVDPPPNIDTVGLRVAIVGSGPAGMYAADELLRHPGVSVDVYERLARPHGLARYGVAPDHTRTRRISDRFEEISREQGFRYVLNTEVGRDISQQALRADYDAVIHAVGASADRALGLAGEDLPGCGSARAFVGWYNGHPDHADLDWHLDQARRVVVVGNGNVALDVARILATDPARLADTEIDSAAWQALIASQVREVVVLGRRSAAEASFTLPELVGLAARDDIDLQVLGDLTAPASAPAVDRAKLDLLREVAARPQRPGNRRVVLRFDAPLQSVDGVDRVSGVTSASGEQIPADLVLRAVGYRGQPVAGLPFDDARGIVPNESGRVEPGVYVAGWIKRGPTGFIGTNRTCAAETVASLLEDLAAGRLGTRERIATSA